MDSICDKQLCCGCEGCRNICPTNSITMKQDIYGVLYPAINADTCINCGLCKKVCIQNQKINLLKSNDCYMAVDSDANRLDSASGGVAAALYKGFLAKNKNSYIAGVKLENGCQPVFSLTNKEEDIEKFRGSKYVQAEIDILYKNIGKHLKQGDSVLLIATPCQIAACKEYIKQAAIDDKNLYLVDLVCHGVAPAEYLKENIQFIAKRAGVSKITKLSFRSNRRFRDFHFYMEGIKHGKKYKYNVYSEEDYYFNAFLKGISLRESCFHCKFAQKDRAGDISIGDFIGYGKNEYSTSSENVKSPSLIFINDDKGYELLKLLDGLSLKKRNPLEAYVEGTSLKQSFIKPDERQIFLNNYCCLGFVNSVKSTYSKKIKRKIFKLRVIRNFKLMIIKLRNMFGEG